MENLFIKKLQIKPGFKVSVIDAPENAAVIFGEIPTSVTFSYTSEKEQDAYFLFAITKGAMLAQLENIKSWVNDKTVVWIFYPKAKTALSADLNLMQSWEDLTKIGFAPCGSAAVNEIWTGIRIKLATAQKKSGVGNAEIAKSEYGEYIDVVNKQITLPADLKLALASQPAALVFYEQLSYSNQKEYVLWILTAKQEKTRLDRLDKLVTKLLTKKKNPAEK